MNLPQAKIFARVQKPVWIEGALGTSHDVDSS